jgi:hypothetical protein
LDVVRGALRRWWEAFAHAFADLLDESAHRIGLALWVLLGRTPMEAERRFWNRGAECPILVDVKDWTDERLIFTCVVWPVLQAEGPNVFRSLDERVEEDKRERIQAVIDRQAPRVQESYQEARRLAERNVDSCWRFSTRCPTMRPSPPLPCKIPERSRL